MSTACFAFTTAQDLSTSRIGRALEGLGELAWEPPRSTRWALLDTFDRRLLRAGDLLEWVPGAAGGRLRWRSLDGELRWHWPAVERPARAGDLPPGRPREALERASAGRALLELAACEGRLTVGWLRNRDARPVLRLELWRRAGERRLEVEGLRGYEAESEAVRERLARCPGLAPGAELPAGIEPRTLWQGAPPRGPLELAPGERCDVALARVLAVQCAVMRANEEGMRADLDEEFLHDYRVALRRSRTLLVQFKRAFPAPRVRRFRRELGWLGEITGPARDGDVFLLDLPALLALVPDPEPGAVAAIEGLVRAQREAARARLLRALDSARYRRVLADWEAFLAAPPPARSALPMATRPVIEVACERIARLHRKTVRHGRRIGPRSPPEAFHELRKECKKLRYVIDAFRALLPSRAAARALRDLKDLQEHLGRFNDLHVQLAEIELLHAALGEGAEGGGARRLLAEIAAVLRAEERAGRAGFRKRFARYGAKRSRRRFAALVAAAGARR